jgi:hypothetical protein
MNTNQNQSQDVKSNQGAVVERQFEGELTLTIILKSWIKKQFSGKQV